MTGLVRTIPPAVTPVSLDELKWHLRVDSTDQDGLLQMYLQAATDFVDGEWGFLGRALVTQTWRLTLDTFPANGQIKIPLPPLQAVNSVKYDDTAGNEQVVDPGTYFIDTDSEPGWVVAEENTQWPATLDAVNTVRVEFIAGYLPDASSPPDLTANVPANIKQGILLTVTDWMENRQNTVDTRMNILPFGADTLLRRHKFNLSMA